MLSMMAVALLRGFLSRRRLLADFVNPNLAGIAAGLALVTMMSVVDCPYTPSPSGGGQGGGLTAPSPAGGGQGGGPPPSGANPLQAAGCVRGGSVFMQHAHGFFAAGSTSSFTGRLAVAKLALKGWLHRPLFGNGSGSFFYLNPTTSGWIGNLPLHILFDTGIVGFLLLLAALVAAGRAALRALRTATAAWEATHFVLFGLVASGVALLASYQFTDGSWLGFTWVFFGMLVAGGRLTRGISQRLRSA
jgi:hypothetical protein